MILLGRWGSAWALIGIKMLIGSVLWESCFSRKSV